MERREFLTKSAVAGALLCSPSFLSATAVRAEGENSAVYTIGLQCDLSHHADKECAVWVPIPSDISGFQRIIEFGARTDAEHAFETDANRYEARTFYARWEKKSLTKKLDIAMKVTLKDRQCDWKRKRVSPDAVNEAALFLAPTPHIPTDGAVANVARKIVGNEKEPLKKAKRIYDWIVANSYRDESVHGCGTGSPNAMLAELEKNGRMGGKCLDMSALCVALMRASGIPAREVLGIRVGPSRFSAAFGSGEVITKAQHCKVEFFIATMGWIPCDPADITKLVLKEGIDRTSPRARELSEKFFGFWENNWLALNHARDFDLYPANAQGMLDSFGYPYGEVEGEYLDPFDPSSFRYAISSKKGVG